MNVAVSEGPVAKRLFTVPVITGLVWLLYLLAGFEPYCHASAVENDDLTRLSLQGLGGVYVAVRALGPEFEKQGLTAPVIKVGTELQLKTAGIPVLTHSQWASTKGGAVCYVEIDVVHDIVMTDVCKSDLYAYVITVEFNQDVFLLRDPTIQALSPTWSSSYLGLTNSPLRIREKVREMVDGFVKTFLAVNPGTPLVDKSQWSNTKPASAHKREPMGLPEKKDQPDAVTGYEAGRPSIP